MQNIVKKQYLKQAQNNSCPGPHW